LTYFSRNESTEARKSSVLKILCGRNAKFREKTSSKELAVNEAGLNNEKMIIQ
jgi:hypothetical protein